MTLQRITKTRPTIIELAQQYRIPTIFANREFVEAGGLLSYGINERELIFRLASVIDEILRGANPGDIPFYRASKFALIINLKTAKPRPDDPADPPRPRRRGDRMRRRTFLSVGPLLLASFQHSVHAWGQAQSLRRIGVIGNLSPLANPAVVPLWNAFLTGLRDRGWEEGRNLVIEARWPEGRMETAIEFAAELVALNPEVILCSNSQVLEALRQRTATIPIVFAGVSHPVEAGFVKSMARPGGNITGITNLLDVVVEKHIELLKELKPGLEKIAVLWSPGNAGSAIGAKWMMESVAPRSGIKISGVPLDLRMRLPPLFRRSRESPRRPCSFIPRPRSRRDARKSQRLLSSNGSQQLAEADTSRVTGFSCSMGQMRRNSGVWARPMLIEFSEVQNRLTFRCKCQRHSNWSST